jgi:hypothetical protein
MIPTLKLLYTSLPPAIQTLIKRGKHNIIVNIPELDSHARNTIVGSIARDHGLNHIDLWEALEGFDWQWQTKRGNLTKRLTGVLRSNYGVGFSEKFMGWLGQYTKQRLIENAPLEVWVRNDFNWERGEFSDEGSCLWTCHSGGRKMMMENNDLFFSLHIKAGNSSPGRCFGYLHRMSVILFNFYGYTPPHFAAALRELLRVAGVNTFDFALDHIKFHNSKGNDIPYINDGGYMLGPAPIVEDTVGVDIAIDGDGFFDNNTCRHCGTIEAESEMEKYDEDWYCQDCTCEYLRVCSVCHETLSEGDAYFNDNEYYCEDCFHERYMYCHKCEEDVLREEAVYITDMGESWCSSCAERFASLCDGCGDIVQEVINAIDSDRSYCENCSGRLTRCERCGNQIENPVVLDGLSYCEICYDKTLNEQEHNVMEKENESETVAV